MDGLWSGWRLGQARGHGSDGKPHANLQPKPGRTLFETIEQSGLEDAQTYILGRWDHTFAILNVYPYNPGHAMVLPKSGVSSISDLTEEVSAELWRSVRLTAAAVRTAYEPTGLNIGINEGSAGGGSQVDHIHIHVVPRWNSDTNYMSTTADVRILPETLRSSWERLRSVWPKPLG